MKTPARSRSTSGPKRPRIYETASAEQRLELDALPSLQLTETTRTSEPLEQVMAGISRTAQERGLTPENPDELLNER